MNRHLSHPAFRLGLWVGVTFPSTGQIFNRQHVTTARGPFPSSHLIRGSPAWCMRPSSFLEHKLTRFRSVKLQLLKRNKKNIQLHLPLIVPPPNPPSHICTSLTSSATACMHRCMEGTMLFPALCFQILLCLFYPRSLKRSDMIIPGRPTRSPSRKAKGVERLSGVPDPSPPPPGSPPPSDPSPEHPVPAVFISYHPFSLFRVAFALTRIGSAAGDRFFSLSFWALEGRNKKVAGLGSLSVPCWLVPVPSLAYATYL